MNEYQARLKTVVNDLTQLRSASGATTSSLLLGLISVLLAKNRITDKDLDIVFETEKQSAAGTMRDLFERSYGDPDFPLNNEGEIDDVLNLYNEYMDKNRDFVSMAAGGLAEEKPRRKKKEIAITEGNTRPTGLHFKPEGPKPDIKPAGQITRSRPVGRTLKESEDPQKNKEE